MSDYCPGAVQRPQPGGVTLDKSLPPRFIWHITWDQLRADGSQPDFSAVANYLAGKQYCPHIMWNPFTGYMEQYYPASVGGRALAYNNQDGAAAVQVEVFFTPGCVVNGVKYDTVADTPLVGLETLLAWGDSLGVPRTWPMGAPQWQGNKRDADIWNTRAGHYGHCHSPGDTHTDPGPMPDFTGTLSLASESITPLEELDVAAVDEIKARLDQIVAWEDSRFNQLAGFVRDVVNAKDSLTPEQLDAKLASFAEGTKPSGQQLFKGDNSPEVYAWDGSSGFRHIEQAEYLTLVSTGAALTVLPQTILDGAVK